MSSSEGPGSNLPPTDPGQAGYPPMGPPPGSYPMGPPPGTYAPPGAAAPYGYQYAAYGFAQDHPQGTIVLVLGILGIVTCQILGPVAWIMGNKALAEIDANPTAYRNRGMVNAGRICGIVGSVLAAVYLLFFVIWIVAFGALAASGGGS